MPTLAAETDFPYEILWFIPASIAVLVLIALCARFMKHRRARGLERFARGRGYSFAARDDDWIKPALAVPLDRGRQHRARNVITGEHHGHRFAMFSHEFVTGSGDSSATRYCVVTAIELPGRLPDLRVARSAPDPFGLIRLESEEFNERFKVAGHRRLAYDVLHPLLDTDAPGFTINDRYLAHLRYGLQEPDRLDADLAYVEAVRGLIPKLVFEPEPR